MKTRYEPRARQVARLSPQARQLRHAVAAWAMAVGHPVNFDALTVIIGTKSEAPGSAAALDRRRHLAALVARRG